MSRREGRSGRRNARRKGRGKREEAGGLKRRLLLIDPGFQWRFISMILGTSLLVVASFYVSHLYFFDRFESVGQALSYPSDHVFFTFLNRQREVMLTVFGVTSGIVVGLVFLMGLFFSHRIAGPMYRLRTHMDRQVDAQKLEKVSFRERDFFPEVAQSFNQLVNRIKKG